MTPKETNSNVTLRDKTNQPKRNPTESMYLTSSVLKHAKTKNSIDHLDDRPPLLSGKTNQNSTRATRTSESDDDSYVPTETESNESNAAASKSVSSAAKSKKKL